MRMSMRVIASLTTIPSRINLLGPVITSVRKQTFPVDQIEINIPTHCKRLGQDYIIPEYLSNDDGLNIFRTNDFGPITKVLPTLIRYENDPDTYIWSLDDDVELDSSTLKTLAEGVDTENPRILTGKGGALNEGWDMQAWYGFGKCNLIEGYGSVLYPPMVVRNVKSTFLALLDREDDDIIFSDDILISMVFDLAGTEIYLRNPEIPLGHNSTSAIDALHNSDQYNRYNRAYNKILAFHNHR